MDFSFGFSDRVPETLVYVNKKASETESISDAFCTHAIFNSLSQSRLQPLLSLFSHPAWDYYQASKIFFAL